MDDPFGVATALRVQARRAAYSLGEQDALSGQCCCPECVEPPLRVDYRIGYGAGRARALTLPVQRGVTNEARKNG